MNGPLRCIALRSPGQVVVVVSGEIDIHTAPELERALVDELGREPTDLVVDMGGVAFIDCGGIDALIVAAGKARLLGRSFALRSPSRRVLRLLDLVALGDVLPVQDGDRRYASTVNGSFATA
jgi:anti-sigma B factor antagonist